MSRLFFFQSEDVEEGCAQRPRPADRPRLVERGWNQPESGARTCGRPGAPPLYSTHR
jgi:hypothetical protein